MHIIYIETKCGFKIVALMMAGHTQTHTWISKNQ